MAHDLDAVLRALAAPARREILSLIWDRDLPAGEIAAAFSLTPATISEHLAVLRAAGLVEMTPVGTSRRYRARQEALAGLHGALETETKWETATEIPERSLARTIVAGAVVASVEVGVDQETAFAAFADPVVYSRWLGAPVTIADGRFAATMEWGTEIRGRYELVVPPSLIAMSWDFEDGNVPVPGQPRVGYLRVFAVGRRRARVEVHQLVDSAEQAEFMEAAWGMVLGRFVRGVVAASRASGPPARRPPRPKRSDSSSRGRKAV
ncbi:MAG: metalloregulator ArsR/SmtB family transcription factor [Frankiaceae bacterium]|nr:metalloregulator ArsR/SmtB family transcription factor [Frankiaceae bacterium]